MVELRLRVQPGVTKQIPRVVMGLLYDCKFLRRNAPKIIYASNTFQDEHVTNSFLLAGAYETLKGVLEMLA